MRVANSAKALTNTLVELMRFSRVVQTTRRMGAAWWDLCATGGSAERRTLSRSVHKLTPMLLWAHLNESKTRFGTVGPLETKERIKARTDKLSGVLQSIPFSVIQSTQWDRVDTMRGKLAGLLQSSSKTCLYSLLPSCDSNLRFHKAPLAPREMNKFHRTCKAFATLALVGPERGGCGEEEDAWGAPRSAMPGLFFGSARGLFASANGKEGCGIGSGAGGVKEGGVMLEWRTWASQIAIA